MRQRVDGLRREQKLDKVRVAARVQFAMAQHGVASCASALFLAVRGIPFTFSTKPFICAFYLKPYSPRSAQPSSLEICIAYNLKHTWL